MSEQLTIKNLYNHMDETIAKDIFEGATYPWEILPKISGFIKELGKTLPADEYDQVGEDVWIAKSATVFQTAYIHGPAIIGKNAEVRQCAFIRGNAIVGVIRQNLSTSSCSTKYRCRTIITWAIPSSATNPTWGPDPSHPMSNPTKNSS